jgi:AbrB family looped-hinge helix DNA binding protein
MELFGNFAKFYQTEILSTKDMQSSMVINVGQRGEIVIPKKMREELGIRVGGEVHITKTEDGLTIRPKASMEEMMKRWARIAKENGIDMSNYNSDDAYDEEMEDQQENVRRY